ncbi:MAG: cupredoxin domain-containing protein, partial [Gemmatimonadales bacterium]
LRVFITRDGEPFEGVNVSWSAGQGGSFSEVAESGEDGIATAVWTLGPELGSQAATATVDGADGSPLTYTAEATDGTGPPPGPTIQVLGPDGGNRFEPDEITITVGQTVTWVWPEGSTGHNVVPDDRNNPISSGPVADGPETHAFTFNTVGAFRYYCQAHGAAAGVGMSGRVLVQAAAP